MEDELVCGWDEFETHAANTIKQLWDDKDFSDVTLATVDDHQISAHRLILSSSSSFFKKILTKNPHNNLLLYLKDIRHNELQLVLEFMYFGECKVKHEDLGNFIATGNILKVKGLIKNEEEPDKSNVKSNLLGKKQIIETHPMEIFTEKGETEPNIETVNLTKEVENSFNSTYNQLEIENTVTRINYESPIDQPPSIEHTNKETTVTQQSSNADRLNKLKEDKSKHIWAQFFKEGFFRCDECPVLYEDLYDLKKHKNTVHGGITYKCSQCEYKSKRFQDGLAPHMIKHGEGLWYYCDKCEFKAAHPKRVESHKKFVHKSASYACNQCDYRSNTEFNVHHHMKAKHEGVRYECDQCDHKAILPNTLLKHKYRYHREDSMTDNKDNNSETE